jgi:hypothetical protein
MEQLIREAKGCTDFLALITYPDTETQIPSHYSFTYTLKGKVIHDEFDNVNPDEVNKTLVKEASEQVNIIELDKKAEFIILKNNDDVDLDLTGWKILSVRGEQSFIFSEYILKVDSTVKIGDSDKNSDVDLHWLNGQGTWSNSKSDPAELYNAKGELVDRYED